MLAVVSTNRKQIGGCSGDIAFEEEGAQGRATAHLDSYM